MTIRPSVLYNLALSGKHVQDGKSTLTPKCKQSFSPQLNDDGFDFKSFIELEPEGIRDVKADTKMLKVWLVE